MKEIQTKVTSFLDFLIKNQKALPLYLGKEKDVIGYLSDKTKFYHEYYEERYKFNQNKNYREGDLYQLNMEINQIKEEIDKIISNNLTDSYHVSGFLQYIARLKKLEDKKLQFSRVKNQTERVENLFGPIKSKKKIVGKKGEKFVEKTSDELIMERNERLAVLYELYSTGNISEEEFIKNVVGVRKCYKRIIDERVIEETKLLSKEPTLKGKAKEKITDVMRKVKKVFKIGKPEPDLQEELQQDYAKKTVINEAACQALIKAKDILSNSQSEKAIDESNACFEDLISIHATIPHLYTSNDLSKELAEMYKGNTRAFVNSSKVITDGYGIKVKDKKEISNIMINFTNHMTKKYKNIKKMNFNEKGQMEQHIIFEDDKAQAIYDEAMEMYKRMENQSELCALVKQKLDAHVKLILDKQLAVAN